MKPVEIEFLMKDNVTSAGQQLTPRFRKVVAVGLIRKPPPVKPAT